MTQMEQTAQKVFLRPGPEHESGHLRDLLYLRHLRIATGLNHGN